MQQAPLAGAQIPYKFVGPWTPPSEYGILISPPINVTAENWPEGAPETAAFPQFATTLGQQIGTAFYFYGTYGYFSPAAPGYLGNNWNQSNLYGAPVGSHMVFEAQVEEPNNWQQAGSLFTIAVPP